MQIISLLFTCTTTLVHKSGRALNTCQLIYSCEVIRDQNNGESLQYAFVEFEKVTEYFSLSFYQRCTGSFMAQENGKIKEFNQLSWICGPTLVLGCRFMIQIDDFRVAFRLCFIKASPSAKPFIWKLVLFTCK